MRASVACPSADEQALVPPLRDAHWSAYIPVREWKRVRKSVLRSCDPLKVDKVSDKIFSLATSH